MTLVLRRTTWMVGFGLLAWTAACEAPTPLTPDQPTLAVSHGKPAGDVTTLSVPTYLVDVNVKHGNEQGKINLKGIRNGNGDGASLAVSVLGTGEFPMEDVDLSSLLIGDATTTPATPLEELKKKYQASLVDLNGDGLLDLMLHFSIGEMVDNGNLSESTTSLCLNGWGGDGPAFYINGCGGVTVRDDDGGNGGGGNGGGGGFTDAEAFSFRSPKTVWAINMPYWLSDDEDGNGAELTFPGWTTYPISSFEAGVFPAAWTFPRSWKQVTVPFGTGNQADLLTTCPALEDTDPSGFYWEDYGNALVRVDFQLPEGSRQVEIEFMVDDLAQVYLNGVSLTEGFQRGDNFGCADYGAVVTLRVPDDLLSPDGNNQLAFWADDTLGYVNYLDFRVVARVPN